MRRLPWRFIAVASGLVLGVATAVLISNAKNAYEIYLDEVSLGVYIPFDKNLTPEHLQRTAEGKLANDVGSPVAVNETVSIKPARANRRDMVTEESAIATVYGRFTYMLEATVLRLDGAELAVLKSDADVDAVLDTMSQPYIRSTNTLAERGFVESVEFVKKFVETSEVLTVEQAVAQLGRRVNQNEPYTVRSGDSLWDIAVAAGLSLDALYEMNPGLTESIKPGQMITIATSRPLLSMRTVEESRSVVIVPKPVDRVENPDESVGYERVVQEGTDGEKEEVVRIVRINGVESARETVRDGVVTKPAVTEIIEVGTKQE